MDITEIVDEAIREGDREMRVNRAQFLAGLALAEQLFSHKLGMRGDEPQQLAADIA